ncbi:hypothetical protein J7481_22720 [Labrenzia sp. R4_2]|uniref:hypothetical protein n=1 Tax=Labrenzia sp. R4_2 TaxID=2821107 RepID=UPI001AD9D52E|nr:hypothetical protein [Labrenzia sp. R4_2]MBO9422342.1 hypothetical protein [Labrenzia sp. R4_2]
MSDRPYSEISAQERIELYCADFGKKLDPASQLADILIGIGDQLGFIFGQDKSDEVMGSISQCLHDDSHPKNDKHQQSWKNIIHENYRKIYTDHPGGRLFFNLLAYAQYGVVIDETKISAELSSTISLMIDQLESFQTSYSQPFSAGESPDQITTLLNWAKARQALDNKNPIDPAGLALLGDVSERTIRNLMSKKQKGLRNVDGKVRFEDAEHWLSSKNGFWNSIWNTQDTSDDLPTEFRREEKYVFVPVSRDGSVFHPGLRDTYGYRVGPKGDQEDFEDYEAALQHLHKATHPYWNRKNTNGMRVLLSGNRWERLSKTELKKFEDDPERRLQTAL